MSRGLCGRPCSHPRRHVDILQKEFSAVRNPLPFLILLAVSANLAAVSGLRFHGGSIEKPASNPSFHATTGNRVSKDV